MGAYVLDELFPGLLDDLAASGATVIREPDEIHFAPVGTIHEGQFADCAAQRAAEPSRARPGPCGALTLSPPLLSAPAPRTFDPSISLEETR